MDRKEYLKQWRLANKDKIKEKKRQWEEKNKEHLQDYYKQYNEEHKEERRIYNSNRKEYFRNYYLENRKKLLEYNKQRYQDKSDYFEKYRKEHSEDKRKWYDEFYSTQIGRATYLYYNYCRHDENKQRGECTLTPEWIVENIFTSKCRYCGKDDWTELGCDRINNDLPHTPDNVVPCCEDCNKRRNITEFEKFINDDSIIQKLGRNESSLDG